MQYKVLVKRYYLDVSTHASYDEAIRVRDKAIRLGPEQPLWTAVQSIREKA